MVCVVYFLFVYYKEDKIEKRFFSLQNSGGKYIQEPVAKKRKVQVQAVSVSSVRQCDDEKRKLENSMNSC